MTDESFDEWVASLPQVCQDMARSHPPDQKYKLTHTGQIGYIHAYSVNGTVTVTFPHEWNPWMEGGREVFGIKLTDLEPFPEES